jgi:F-type H+-transporting ATPase subunit b
MDMIQSRQKEIDDLYADAEAAKVNANAMEEEYKNRLATAQQTGDNLVKEAMARGKNREEEIIRQANREADAIRSKAAADIAQEKKKAINDAKDEISGLAMAIAGKVVGRVLSDADQANLVDRFIEELGEQA